VPQQLARALPWRLIDRTVEMIGPFIPDRRTGLGSGTIIEIAKATITGSVIKFCSNLIASAPAVRDLIKHFSRAGKKKPAAAAQRTG
jgi:hypothetical protein